MQHMEYNKEILNGLEECKNGELHRAVMVDDDSNIIIKINQKRGFSWVDTGMGMIFDVNNGEIKTPLGTVLVWLNMKPT